MLLSLFSSLFCQTPFAGPLLRHGEEVFEKRVFEQTTPLKWRNEGGIFLEEPFGRYCAASSVRGGPKNFIKFLHHGTQLQPNTKVFHKTSTSKRGKHRHPRTLVAHIVRTYWNLRYHRCDAPYRAKPCSQRALRDILMSRGKNWLPAISRQFLTLNYPRPKLSPNMPPKLPLPHNRGHFFLFQNCPRGEGNCAAVERQKLSRGNFCLAASRCLSGPSGLGRLAVPQIGAISLLVLSFTQAHLCDTSFCSISRDNCAIPHKRASTKEFRETISGSDRVSFGKGVFSEKSISRDCREFRDFRDSRDSSREKDQY